ncbi:ABC transporter permease [Micromonospora sp. M12]
MRDGRVAGELPAGRARRASWRWRSARHGRLPHERPVAPAGPPARTGRLRGLTLTLAIGWLVVLLDGGQLFNQSTTVSLLHVAAGLGLVAVGQTLVILGGSLDLSVAYVISLSTRRRRDDERQRRRAAARDRPGAGRQRGHRAAQRAPRHQAPGQRVHRDPRRRAAAQGYLDNGYDGPAGATSPSLVQSLGYQRIGPVPVSFLLLVAVTAAAWFALTRTRFGHHLVAVGGDPEVARLSGVRNDRILVTAHVLCSMCAGLAGIYLASRLGSGAPGSAPRACTTWSRSPRW